MKITVVLGGNSAERDISLQSGSAVAGALKSRGHQVSCVDPADAEFQTYKWSDCDVIFIALHGEFGEDGQIQKLLDQKKIPYTGSGAVASKCAFHKSQAKDIFEKHNIATPPTLLFDSKTGLKEISQQAAKIGYPLFIKPDAQGSSIGISIVHHPEELEAAIDLCLKYDSIGLIQKAISGTEWTLGIFNEITFPIIQICFAQPYYDHAAKYEDDATNFLLENSIDDAIKQKLISAGRKAYQMTGASGVARVDFILDEQNEPWVLEVNTIPGMTDHSTVPKAAKKMGWSFAELCEKICIAAIEDFENSLG